MTLSKQQVSLSLQDYCFKMFNSKKETMKQSLPFKSNEGKLIKLTNRVSKCRMKAEKSKRHSLKLHFHRQVYFLSEVFN